jgi:site-specific DNA recombinase
MPTQAAVYVRVSTDAQAERGVSLDAQEATCLRYCAAHGLTVAHLLREEGESAYKLPLADRTEGSRLLGLVASGQVQAVVAYQLSRVFRDDLEAIGYVREWARVGAHWRSCGRYGGSMWRGW